MLSTGHGPLDDRIFYKEVISLKKRYSSIVLIMPDGKDDFDINDPQIKYIPLRKVHSLISRFVVIPEALIKVLKLKPAVCHFHDFEFIFALPIIRLFSKIKIIYDIHEVYPEMALDSTKLPKLFRSFLAKLVDVSEKVLSRFSHYIVTTDDDIAARFQNGSYHVSTIFNYPRLSLFIPDERKVSSLKEEFRDKIPIVYSGGMDINKGLFQMIQSMALIKKSRNDIVLLLIGPMTDKLEKKVSEEINRLGIDDCVKVLGWIPHHEIVNYIAISKIGLIANQPIKKWYKNIPIKQFEYMICGVPVLGSNLPPIASYLNISGAGKTFDTTYTESLVDGILDILNDNKKWQVMSEAGQKATTNWWNWGIMEKKLFKVYENVLNGATSL